jgi:plastocyanin
VRPSARRSVALVVALGSLALALLLGGERPGPYVITAIDYHFHDAHPTFPIGPGRDLVVKNAGRNVHNVTIAALDYSEDVRPGDELVIEDVASRLGAAGGYTLFCRYHEDRGMTGSIVVVDG